jgi:hypothetical protein
MTNRGIDRPELDMKALACLMSVEPEANLGWTEIDLAEILQHQLQTPLANELNRLEDTAPVDQILADVNPPIRTFSNLLHHPAPPLELLKCCKQYAKAMAASEEELLPREVARVIYLASIVVARRRCQQRISTLRDADLAEGLRWLARQTWVDDLTRQLVQEEPTSQP